MRQEIKKEIEIGVNISKLLLQYQQGEFDFDTFIEKSIIEKLIAEEDKEYISIHTESQINGNDNENGRTRPGKIDKKVFPYFVSHGGLKNGGGSTTINEKRGRNGKRFKP